MKTKAGVWIDHRKAVVVQITDDGEETRQINSDVVRPFASAGDPGSTQPDRSQGFMTESTQEHTFSAQLGSLQ